jgi:hypothetical protein
LDFLADRFLANRSLADRTSANRFSAALFSHAVKSRAEGASLLPQAVPGFSSRALNGVQGWHQR